MSLQDIELARMRVEETRQYYMNESSFRRALAERKTEEKENSVHKHGDTPIILFSKLINLLSRNREVKPKIEERKVIHL